MEHPDQVHDTEAAPTVTSNYLDKVANESLPNSTLLNNDGNLMEYYQIQSRQAVVDRMYEQDLEWEIESYTITSAETQVEVAQNKSLCNQLQQQLNDLDAAQKTGDEQFDQGYDSFGKMEDILHRMIDEDGIADQTCFEKQEVCDTAAAKLDHMEAEHQSLLNAVAGDERYAHCRNYSTNSNSCASRRKESEQFAEQTRSDIATFKLTRDNKVAELADSKLRSERVREQQITHAHDLQLGNQQLDEIRIDRERIEKHYTVSHTEYQIEEQRQEKVDAELQEVTHQLCELVEQIQNAKTARERLESQLEGLVVAVTNKKLPDQPDSEQTVPQISDADVRSVGVVLAFALAKQQTTKPKE